MNKRKRILIANRGEIAVRLIKACRELGIETVLAASEADQVSMGAKLADSVICIGPASSSLSYLNIPAIIKAAQTAKADAIHPGYGFLAENPELPEACDRAGLIFIGPSAKVMRQLGDKITARRIARENRVPINEGSEGLSNYDDVEKKAKEIGFPLLFKASAGGGGRGMRIVTETKDLQDEFMTASSEAQAAFGDPTLFIERYIQNGRHVEVQILGDNFGNVVHLGLRDCTPQRRYQKVIEESPPAGLSESVFNTIAETAVRLATSIGYNSAGTVEFLVDKDRNQFYFMEVNTRVQVEHPVTEMVTGIDIVQEQIRMAFGDRLSLSQSDVHVKGHAIECRITAEDTADDFCPSPGEIEKFVVPDGKNIRVDTHCYKGYEISPYYDSLMAKVIARGENREAAIKNMKTALSNFAISGVESNIPFLQFLIDEPDFVNGNINIKWIENKVLPKFMQKAKQGSIK